MVTFAEGLRNTLGSAFCTLARFNEDAISTIIEYSPVPTNTNPSRIALGLARWAIRNYCNYEPPEVTDPPFTGGQCPVFYTTTSVFRGVFVGGTIDPNVEGNPFINTSQLGPLQGARVVETSTAFELRLFSTAWAGNPTGNILLGTLNKSAYESATVLSFSAVRADGFPDDCGNPVPEFDAPPPPVPPVTINFTYQDGDDNDVEFEGNIVYAPVEFNLNGEVIIPFRLDIDPTFDIQINGSLNVNTGDLNFNFGNPNFNPTPFPTPDDYTTDDDIPDVPPGVPVDIPNPSPDNSEPDTVTVIRGVIVTVTSYEGDVTVIGQGDNPDIYAPNLGFINFGITVGGRQAWSHDIPVKNFRQIIECPWIGGATSVAGTPRIGVEWTLSPVRATSEETITFS